MRHALILSFLLVACGDDDVADSGTRDTGTDAQETDSGAGMDATLDDSGVDDAGDEDAGDDDAGDEDAGADDAGADGGEVDGGTDVGPDTPLTCEGIASGEVCCPSTCGECGGVGCDMRPGGAACCFIDVLYSERSCRDNPPPCVLLEDPPDDPCTGIRAGSICCEAACGACGGPGCDTRPGGPDACCGSNIRESGRDCATDAPPCVVSVP